jgi:Fe-S-cluster containining protein
MAGLQDPSPCQSCGACCSFSADWPRFTLEEDAAIARIPEAFVARSGMRCIGDRCSALQGKIGEATACQVYDVRPDVCRACQPGDEECNMARQRFGMPELETEAASKRTSVVIKVTK